MQRLAIAARERPVGDRAQKSLDERELAALGRKAVVVQDQDLLRHQPVHQALDVGLRPLGERGHSLSVGERQLLSFARALAFDPLILILDEATSSVDSALEARIEAALDELMRGRTSLVIAHRLSTIQHADCILVMHHGVIVEAGTHAELLARGGLYSRLYELQFARGGPGAVGAGDGMSERPDSAERLRKKTPA